MLCIKSWCVYPCRLALPRFGVLKESERRIKRYVGSQIRYSSKSFTSFSKLVGFGFPYTELFRIGHNLSIGLTLGLLPAHLTFHQMFRYLPSKNRQGVLCKGLSAPHC